MVVRAAVFSSIVAAGSLLNCGGNGDSRPTPVPTITTTTLISGDVPYRVPRCVTPISGIPSHGVASSTLMASGVRGTITDVNVSVSILSPFHGPEANGGPCDMSIWIAHPDGTRVELLRVDFRPTNLSCAGPLITTFPTLMPTPFALGLGAFRGKGVDGTWTLFVGNDSGCRFGVDYVLNAWQLEVTTTR